ncbi:hypothetical protein MLD38_007656 [Melastoma candidum]|uniref:Uncharacterized protein n=1 Tax=Melastoma candidum TaxID=119954 RepID=A0ACB9RTP3_9MYRT|nr:hypothetical protein MLD38_007656 [Melastoma candidum]
MDTTISSATPKLQGMANPISKKQNSKRNEIPAIMESTTSKVNVIHLATALTSSVIPLGGRTDFAISVPEVFHLSVGEHKEKMKDDDETNRIQQIVQFTSHEIEEKVNIIFVFAENEFNSKKLQIVEVEKKKKIRHEYEQTENRVEICKKIEYSMQLDTSRIKVL